MRKSLLCSLSLILIIGLTAPVLVLAQEMSYRHYDSITTPGAPLEKTQAVSYDEPNQRLLVATGMWSYGSTLPDFSGSGAGIFLLDTKTNSFINYSSANANLPTNNYLSICGGDNLIIAGSYNQGITVINGVTGEVTVFNKDTSPALKTNFYTLKTAPKTAPISAVAYENGKIYFAYGEFTEVGICGGVIDLASRSLMHYSHLFSTRPKESNWPYSKRRPTSLFITDTDIFFADRYLTRFNKITGSLVAHREDNADTPLDWGPDLRLIAYDQVTDRLFVADTAGERFSNNFGLRIYSGALNYLGHWDDTPASQPTQMLGNNVYALKIKPETRKLYLAHVRHDAIPGRSANIGNLQVVDLDQMAVVKNYVSVNENSFDNRIPSPVKLLPKWLRAWYDWANIISSLAVDNQGKIYVGQCSTPQQIPGDGGGLGIIAPGNLPPTALAGLNQDIQGESQAQVIIKGTATDPYNDPLKFRWCEGGTELIPWQSVGANGEAYLDLSTLTQPFSSGQHTLTLEVSDGKATSTSEMILTVSNSAPHAAPAGGGIYQVGSPIILGGQVADFDGEIINYVWVNGDEVLFSGQAQTLYGGEPVNLANYTLPYLGVGTHKLTLKVDDNVNQIVVSEITVEVIDTAAPTLVAVVDKGIFWPPNHEMVDLTISAYAQDNSGGPVTLTATVASNEPESGLGDGDQTPDWTTPVIDQANGLIRLKLRAERSGRGKGRIYTITVTATDDCGNASQAQVGVLVSHDKWR